MFVNMSLTANQETESIGSAGLVSLIAIIIISIIV
jgi:hypothetical protein